MALDQTDHDACTMTAHHQFHSRYDPVLEAERFLLLKIGNKRPAIFFIIGGGINYIGLAVSRLFPGALRVSLQPCDDFKGSEIDLPDFSWYPSCGRSISSVITDALARGHQAGGVSVIEWPAVVSCFPLISEEIRKTIKNTLESTSSGLATSSFWARRWLRNSIRFVNAVSHFAIIEPGTSTIVIACAGPSLTSEMEAIRALGQSITLWSLASAVPALRAIELEPELIISTDPGFWNGEHLRCLLERTCPLAFAPSSYAQISVLKSTPIIPLDTGLVFETAAIKASANEGIKASASGSALGTALSLALSMTSERAIIVGYDLAARGIDDHVRPYPFDILEEIAASRKSPVSAIRSERVYENFPQRIDEWRLSRAFSAYASSIFVPGYEQNRVIRLGNSPVDSGLPRGNLEHFKAMAGRPPRIDMKDGQLDPDPLLKSAAIKTMLDELISQSMRDAKESIKAGIPILDDTVLIFKALAAKESALALAEAARGRANIESLSGIERAARHSGQELMRIH
jgi:hypothetical protein